ncbi:MAG: peptidase MA family metallohydrolase [Nitrospirota bacterium]
MSNKSVALIFIACILVFSSPACAIEREFIENDQVIVQYEKPLQAVANEIIRLYPSVKKELQLTFKSSIDFKPVVWIIEDRTTFQKTIKNESVVAVAIYGKNLIIIDNSRMKTHPFTLEVTLKHELCHLFLHNLAGTGNLPRWFNEGVSQWASGGIAEIIMGENKDLLKQATLSGRLIRIHDLSQGFPGDKKGLRMAYQESLSIVEYIDKEFGTNGILQIMNYLKEGHSIDAAIRKALSIPLYELENRWHESLRKKYTWFTYLSSHLYQILFSFAAFVLIYGFIKLMIRRRAYRDEEEETEIDE